jgi:hypothetical protein
VLMEIIHYEALLFVFHIQHYTCNICFLQREFPSCDFEEYNYGSKAHWPSEYEFVEFEAGIKPWPCTTILECKCKCGIKAYEGVVPSELGYGYYCGNAYGGPTEFWVSSLTVVVIKSTMFMSLLYFIRLCLLRRGGHAIRRTTPAVEP